MSAFIQKRGAGFTVVELMVVISIIVVLLSIIMASINDARMDSRDKKRVMDISNIAHALTLYKEKYRQYPIYQQGVTLGTSEAKALDDEIVLLNGNKYNDPLFGTEARYVYRYHSHVLCNGVYVQLVIALSMEKEKNSNFADECGVNANFASSYIQLLK